MHDVEAYITTGPKTNISPLEIPRDWMAENKWAYNCFPVTLVNKLGFGISFDEDISFVWDGTTAPGPNAGIEILSGKDHCYFDRGGGVIGFPTNFIFKTNPDVSLLTIPVPNLFIEGFEAFSSILSTSFYTGAFHVVGRVTSPNKLITIKAGTPVAAVIPINLSSIQGSTVTIKKKPLNNILHGQDYVDALTEYGKEHKRPAMWFQKAVNQTDEKIGSHEVSSIKLSVVTEL